ncbi:MAG: GTPase domain-containing protein [Bacilli bacterium]|nr:GTPase domain-containing protein [Bacilli bacterium]
MSETLFDYRCVCLGGNSKGQKVAEGKDLQFFLVRDFGAKSHENGMRVQIVFPKKFRKDYKYARIELEKNAVGLPDKAKGEGPLPLYREAFDLNDRSNSDSAPDTNSLFISGQGEDISCQGRISFIRPEYGVDVKTEDLPLEDTYVFAINYRQKNKIYYEIIEKGKNIICDIVYPRLLKDLKLNIVRKEGSKPITVSDHRLENVIKKKKDERKAEEIILKKNALDSNHIVQKVYVDKTDGYNFRLIFSTDNEWNPSSDYILLDESKPTDVVEKDKEEKERLAEEKKIINKRKAMGNVPICPYCGRRIAPNAVESRSGIFDCQGKRYILGKSIEFDRKDLKRKKKLIFCGEDLKTKSSGAITANKLMLPEGYEYRPAPKIVTVGYPKSGKTIFLSSLINMKRNTDNAYASDPFILDEILRFFSTKHHRKQANIAMELHSYGLKEAQSNQIEGKTKVFTLDENYEKAKGSDEGVNGLQVKSRFAINVDGLIESQTSSSQGATLSWNPIGYRLGNLGHMYFYDVPGEYFIENQINGRLHSVDVADGFIALLDTNYESDEKEQNADKSKKNLTPADNLVSALEQLKKLSPEGRDLKNIPVAVVLTKIDHHYDEHYDPRLAQFKDVFDPNCHVTQKNMAQLFPKNGKYEGSDLQVHIDDSSYEIEEYLKGKKWGKQINAIKAMFPNLKFFALSALGSDDVLGEAKTSSKEIRYLPSRVRMELPIVWLMVQTGLIRR